jgi:heme A synthase
VAALGDTLFPANSLVEGLQQDFSPTAHILVRLRLLHPLIAVSVGILVILAGAICNQKRPNPVTRRFTRTLTVLYIIQLGAGALNVALLAPVWLQLGHLLLADLIWITLVLLASSALARPAHAEIDQSLDYPKKGAIWHTTPNLAKPPQG